VSISYIDKLIDGNDNIYYPETKEKAITDDDGVALSTKLSTLSTSVEEAKETAANVTSELKAFTVTLTVDGWTSVSGDDSAPYTQSVNVDGITAEMNFQPPFVDSTGDQETDDANQEALSCISGGETADGIVTFWCYESKPEVDLNIILVRRF
jgi:hypothetical protein